MSITLRLAACVATILLVSFVSTSAAIEKTCTLPSGSKDVYSLVNSSADTRVCAAALCSCLGASTWTNGTVGCSWTATAVRPNCSKTTSCTALYILCMDTVDANNTDLHLSNIAIASGELYNTSVAYTDCKYRTCAIFNQTAPSDSATCTTPYATVCTSPVTTSFTLRIEGNFSAIFANKTLVEILRLAIQLDLTNVLGFDVTVTNISQGSLIVAFTVPVAASNPLLATRLSVASTSATWLTNTQTTYLANGGTGSLSVLSLGTPSPTTTPAPGTPTTPAPSPSAAGIATIVQILLAVVALVLLA